MKSVCWLFLSIFFFSNFEEFLSSETPAPGILTCNICQQVATIYGNVADSIISLDDGKAMVYEICIKNALFSDVVCQGTVNEYGPEFVYIATQLSIQQRGNVCAEMGVCPHNGTTTVDDTTTQNLKHSSSSSSFQKGAFVPKPRLRSLNKKSSQLHLSGISDNVVGDIGKFGHVTDIHLDPFYFEGSEVDCGLPLCCRRSNGLGKTPETRAPKFGSIDGYCDLPIVTFESAIQSIASHNLDFLLVTGDYPAHDIWDQTEDRNLACNQIVATALGTGLPDKVGVFPLIGNHEGYPMNQFRGPVYDAWLYNGSANVWAKWLSDEALSTVQHSGYYTALIRPGLRVIGLNSPLWMLPSENFWQLLSETSVCREEMLLWFEQVLSDASKNNERVLILTHVPYLVMMPRYADAVSLLFEQYEDIIIASFGGHVHTDFWQVFKKNDATKRPVGIHFSSPALTTYITHNPSYRVFYYNTTTFELLDVETYYANITRANNEGKITWELAYSAVKGYNMTGLRAADWQQVNDQLATNQDLFDFFFKNYHQQQVSPPGPTRTCDAKCKKSELCTLNSGTAEQKVACMKL